MNRYCANCGTEVDETAVFCPTCGQPIDEKAESEMPLAPAWPDPEPPATSAAFAPVDPPPGAEVQPEVVSDSEATRVEPVARVDAVSEPDEAPAQPPTAASPVSQAPRAAEERVPDRPAVDLPITMPVTLSGWLIGGGAALAAIGALLALFDGLGSALDIILLLALLAVAVSVFLSDRMPHVPQLRLVTMVVVLVAFGVALDRLGFGRAGAGELLLFLGTAAAGIGAILLETGRDQPLGGPSA